MILRRDPFKFSTKYSLAKQFTPSVKGAPFKILNSLSLHWHKIFKLESTIICEHEDMFCPGQDLSKALN